MSYLYVSKLLFLACVNKLLWEARFRCQEMGTLCLNQLSDIAIERPLTVDSYTDLDAVVQCRQSYARSYTGGR